MGLRDSYPPGTFCWVQNMTSEGDGACGYYGALFGWSFAEPGRASLQEHLIAGIGHLAENNTDRASHWLSFVSVSDIESHTQRAQGLGAQLLSGPSDVGGRARVAVFRDPLGTRFAMWQPAESHGAERVNEHGCLCWNELLTHDPETAGSFYSTLFDWTIEPYGDSYTIFMNGERPAGGLMPLGEDSADAPTDWLVYFMVDDCDAIHDRSNSLGGSVQMPPDDWPEVGRGAVLVDPQGAAFGAMNLLDPPD